MTESMSEKIAAAALRIAYRVMRERSGSERMTLPEWEAYAKHEIESTLICPAGSADRAGVPMAED